MTNKKLTNRQAIGVLDGLWSNPLFGEAHRQAFEIGIKAIKALEQESELDKIKGYINYIRNTGMGKNKSLEFIEKFIEGLKAESENKEDG